MFSELARNKKISLNTFLSYFVFKDLVMDNTGLTRQSSQTVRIFYDAADPNHWFEFGMSDFGDKPDKFNVVLRDDILDRMVVGFYVAGSKLCVSISDEHLSDDEDYQFENDKYKNEA